MPGTHETCSVANWTDLARKIHQRHRSLLREFRIEPVEGGVALHCFAYSFYGKQNAQHEILQRCDLPIITNLIVVAATCQGG